LPTGLNIGLNNGLISGTPTVAGSFAFAVRVTSGAGSATKNFRIIIAGPLTITTRSLASTTVNRAYGQILTATGGHRPYAWSIASGSLPTSLTLNASTGRITGRSTTAGTYNFTVGVSDVNSLTASSDLYITVN
jgi:hypothetical protein